MQMSLQPPTRPLVKTGFIAVSYKRPYNSQSEYHLQHDWSLAVCAQAISEVGFDSLSSTRCKYSYNVEH